MSQNRIAIRLEFYLRGKKRRTPSVTFIEGDEGLGIPLTSHAPSEKEKAAWAAFSDAAHEFCKQLRELGELK